MLYIFGIIGLGLGILVGWFMRQQIAQRQADSAEAKAKDILTKAKVKQQEMYFRSREESLKIIDEAKREEASRRQELKISEDRLERRQSLFEKKILELEEKQRFLNEQTNRVEEAKNKIREIYNEAKKELERIS